MTDQSNSVQPGPAEPRPNFPSTFGGLGLPQRSVGLKLLLVCGLALLLAIPSLFIYGVVLERSDGSQVAFNAVSEKVGGRQSVLGPVIGVPYAFAPDPEKPDKLDYSLGIVYPESGQADVDVQLEERQRGIHTVPVYTADISLYAEFHADNILNALPPGAKPIWRDARVYFGVSDRRGIREPFKAAIDGAELDIEPANQRQYATSQYDPVPQANVSLASATIDGLELLSGDFRITANMVVSGADRFAVGPFAKDTEVVLRSNWLAPSFTGGV
ncbi:MAG: inner membrane CreD family protein, partial [Pseudomonadota bacterium]